MNFEVNVGFVGPLLKAVAEWASERPVRFLAVFFTIFLLSAAAALGFPHYRFAFGVAAFVALLAISAVASLVAFPREPGPGEAATPGGSNSGRPAGAGAPDSESLDHRRGISNLIQFNSATFQHWREGKFADARAGADLRRRVLETGLTIDLSRLHALGLRNASIIVVRREGDEYLVRRVVGPLQACLERGDRCPALSDLKPALLRYAPYSSIVYPVTLRGKLHSVAVTSEVPFDEEGHEEAERIALQYQTQYERLWLFARAPLPLADRLPTS